jgi:hypothetical protein
VKKELLLAIALTLGATAFVAACASSIVEGGRPLSIEVVADRTTAATGDTIAFVVEARGNNLVGVTLSYGDGVVDSFPGIGAVSLGQDTSHVYTEAGDYMVRATVIDLLGSLQTLTDSVPIQITASGQ